MKIYWIKDIDTCNRCIGWLKENNYRPFVMQYDWYQKEGFIMYLYNQSEEIEVHTKTEEVQKMLIGYMVEFNRK